MPVVISHNHLLQLHLRTPSSRTKRQSDCVTCRLGGSFKITLFVCLSSAAPTCTGNVTYVWSVTKKGSFWNDTKRRLELCDKPPTWKHIHLTSFNSHIIRRDHFHLHVVSTSAGGLLSRDKFLWRDKQCSATSPLLRHSHTHWHISIQSGRPTPLDVCDTGVVAPRSPTRPEKAISMMELFLHSVQNSLTRWSKDNGASFILSCNYTDLIPSHCLGLSFLSCLAFASLSAPLSTSILSC